MRSLMATILLTSLTAGNVYGGVKEDVELLGKLAMGSGVHSVKGENAESIFMNWLEKEYGEDEERKLINKEIEDMAYGDEVDVGFTSTRSAIEMKDFAISSLEERIEDYDNYGDETGIDVNAVKAKIYDLDHKWAPVIKRLEKQGAKFGYTGHGPGYCGVSFVELIVVDPKEQKLYEVYLSESGEC